VDSNQKKTSGDCGCHRATPPPQPLEVQVATAAPSACVIMLQVNGQVEPLLCTVLPVFFLPASSQSPRAASSLHAPALLNSASRSPPHLRASSFPLLLPPVRSQSEATSPPLDDKQLGCVISTGVSEEKRRRRRQSYLPPPRVTSVCSSTQ